MTRPLGDGPDGRITLRPCGRIQKLRGTCRGTATLTSKGNPKMCKLCDEGKPQDHSGSQLGRRDFLKTTAAGGAAAGLGLFAARPAGAHDDDAPEDSGRNGRRYIIRGGAVMSMDPKVGDFPSADVLVEGKKILAVGPNLHAGGAD